MCFLQVGAEGPTTSTGCTLQVNSKVEAFAQCKALTTGLRLLWSLSPDQQVTEAHLNSQSPRTWLPCTTMDTSTTPTIYAPCKLCIPIFKLPDL